MFKEEKKLFLSASTLLQGKVYIGVLPDIIESQSIGILEEKSFYKPELLLTRR
jgi:hypothetical protein